MEIKVPLLLMPQRAVMTLAHRLHGVAAFLRPRMKFVEKPLMLLDVDTSATDYISMSLFNSLVYFVFAGLLVFIFAYKLGIKDSVVWALVGGVVTACVVFLFCSIYPKWLSNKKVKEIDRDLLFAARHLKIQTTTGVPLFDSLVSASHGYGMVSKEFEKIVVKVQGGVSLADALEESSMKNPSYYYNRILWQLSSAVKTGGDVGSVLSQIVDFLAEEQRIEMHSYGAELNTLAIMYLMGCIVAPTIALIFMLVITSFVDVPITDTVFIMLLGVMIFVQYMFIGMIESRRPVISV